MESIERKREREREDGKYREKEREKEKMESIERTEVIEKMDKWRE
jgi:hypothetical protein